MAKLHELSKVRELNRIVKDEERRKLFEMHKNMLLTKGYFWKRLSSRIEITDSGCWEWKGANVNGYGTIVRNKKVLRLSRVVWEIENGKIPKGMLVCHRCDNPSCINIDHLFLGTHKDNSDDKIKKGRQNPTRKPRKLSKEDVNSIRNISKDGYLSTIIAKKFNVSESLISRILSNKRRIQ